MRKKHLSSETTYAALVSKAAENLFGDSRVLESDRATERRTLGSFLGRRGGILYGPTMARFPMLSVDGSVWTPHRRGLFYALFEEPPADGRRAKVVAGMPRFLRERLEWRGSLIVFGCKDIPAQVRKAYGGRSTKLTDEERAHFSSEDYDPKVLGMVEAAMRDFADRRPWIRFDAALFEWLHEVHGRQPIALFVRPGLPLPDPEHPADPNGLEAVYLNAERIAALSGDESPSDPARGFIEELAVFAATAPTEADRFAPCLPYSFGVDQYSTASVALLRALSDSAFEHLLSALPPTKRIVLMLRTDVVSVFLERRGSGDRLRTAFAELRDSQPSAEHVDRVGFHIQYAVSPCARAADTSMLRATIDELASHGAFWAPAIHRFTSAGQTIAGCGHPELGARFDAAVAAVAEHTS